MANRYNIQFFQGEDWAVDCKYTEADGQPIDITSLTIHGKIRDGAGALIASFAVNKVEPVLGFFRVSLPNAVTSNMLPGVYNHDVECVEIAKKLLWGTVAVIGEQSY